jgi:hypothetical protein
MCASIATEVESGTATVCDRGPQGYSSGHVRCSAANMDIDSAGPAAQAPVDSCGR